MDTNLEGIVRTPPAPASEDPAEKRIKFLLFRETEQEEISCMSSLRFNPTSIKLAVGSKVILFGYWVTEQVSGNTTPEFYFSRAMVIWPGN
jgi:hypothetical protein